MLLSLLLNLQEKVDIALSVIDTPITVFSPTPTIKIDGTSLLFSNNIINIGIGIDSILIVSNINNSFLGTGIIDSIPGNAIASPVSGLTLVFHMDAISSVFNYDRFLIATTVDPIAVTQQIFQDVFLAPIVDSIPSPILIQAPTINVGGVIITTFDSISIAPDIKLLSWAFPLESFSISPSVNDIQFSIHSDLIQVNVGIDNTGWVISQESILASISLFDSYLAYITGSISSIITVSNDIGVNLSVLNIPNNTQTFGPLVLISTENVSVSPIDMTLSIENTNWLFAISTIQVQSIVSDPNILIFIDHIVNNISLNNSIPNVTPLEISISSIFNQYGWNLILEEINGTITVVSPTISISGTALSVNLIQAIAVAFDVNLSLSFREIESIVAASLAEIGIHVDLIPIVSESISPDIRLLPLGLDLQPAVNLHNLQISLDSILSSIGISQSLLAVSQSVISQLILISATNIALHSLLLDLQPIVNQINVNVTPLQILSTLQLNALLIRNSVEFISNSISVFGASLFIEPFAVILGEIQNSIFIHGVGLGIASSVINNLSDISEIDITLHFSTILSTLSLLDVTTIITIDSIDSSVDNQLGYLSIGVDSIGNVIVTETPTILPGSLVISLSAISSIISNSVLLTGVSLDTIESTPIVDIPGTMNGSAIPIDTIISLAQVFAPYIFTNNKKGGVFSSIIDAQPNLRVTLTNNKNSGIISSNLVGISMNKGITRSSISSSNAVRGRVVT